MTVGSHPSDEQLERYILRQLSADHDTIIEEHYLVCSYCQKRITQLNTPEFSELVVALRSIKEEAVTALHREGNAHSAPKVVPVRVLHRTPINVRWISAIAAAAVILLTVAGLRLRSGRADAPVAVNSWVTPTPDPKAALGFTGHCLSGSRSTRVLVQHYGIRSRRYVRSIPPVHFAACCIFHPPVMLWPVIMEPSLDADLQILAVADIEEPLQFTIPPEIAPAPKKSPWRRLFAAVSWPFRHILSQAN
jgi:hypothetical protein